MYLNVKEDFFTWLSGRIPAVSLSELEATYMRLEQSFLDDEIIFEPLFEITDASIIQDAIDELHKYSEKYSSTDAMKLLELFLMFTQTGDMEFSDQVSESDYATYQLNVKIISILNRRSFNDYLKENATLDDKTRRAYIRHIARSEIFAREHDIGSGYLYNAKSLEEAILTAELLVKNPRFVKRCKTDQYISTEAIYYYSEYLRSNLSPSDNKQLNDRIAQYLTNDSPVTRNCASPKSVPSDEEQLSRMTTILQERYHHNKAKSLKQIASDNFNVYLNRVEALTQKLYQESAEAYFIRIGLLEIGSESITPLSSSNDMKIEPSNQKDVYTLYFDNETFVSLSLDVLKTLNVLISKILPINGYDTENVACTTNTSKNADSEIPTPLVQDYYEKALDLLKDQIFTIPYLRKIFSHPLNQYNMNNDFYESIFISKEKIKFCRYNGWIIFKQSDKPFNFSTFIKELVSRKGSVNIYELKQFIIEEYGITLKCREIYNFAKEAGLFYSNTDERLYANYNDFLTKG